ncbi:Sodium/hydrogen exchanger family-domain-containing protein [Gongronella butleri]|nr:Sodium/hydrogen exchanger family-domain-containing protein [Gongronella butleri]
MVDLTHVETISVIYSILGGFILLYGLCSLTIKERLYISEAMVAVAIGVLFGPLCANFINVASWGGDETYITRELTRLCIGIQVMAAGVSLPKAYLRREWRSMAIMLLPVMIVMWIMTALCVWAMIPNLSYLESLMIASCFTPTDPVLANSIVSGKFAEKRVPINVRHLILSESGANDGLGFPFLYLAIYLMQQPVGPALGEWAYHVLVYEILLSTIIGFAVGYVARKLLKLAEKNKLIDKESFLVYAIALALFLMGTVSLMGSDDLLACFIAGNSFTWDDWFRKETENAHMSEPWAMFYSEYLQLTPWRLVVLALLVLLLRRLPVVVGLYKWVPAIHTWREALFTGWFGPIGVGAIFYYTEAIENFAEDGPDARVRGLVGPIVYFMVLSSVIVHGITIPLFHIGTFASRTLTRTSMSSAGTTPTQILRLPRLRRRLSEDHHAAMGMPSTTSSSEYFDHPKRAENGGTPSEMLMNGGKELDLATLSDTHAATPPPPAAHRQTAITIVIPDHHSHHGSPAQQHQAGTTLLPTSIYTTADPHSLSVSHATTDDDSDERASLDSTQYLPDDDDDDDHRRRR